MLASMIFMMPMPPDNETDGGDNAAAHARVADLLVDALQLGFLGVEAEVLDAAMGEHEDVSDLLQGGIELIEGLDFDVQVGQAVVGHAVGVADGAEAHPGSVERHVDGEVFTVKGPVAVSPARAPGGADFGLPAAVWRPIRAAFLSCSLS